jgi:hypothetical protein
MVVMVPVERVQAAKMVAVAVPVAVDIVVVMVVLKVLMILLLPHLLLPHLLLPLQLQLPRLLHHHLVVEEGALQMRLKFYCLLMGQSSPI